MIDGKLGTFDVYAVTDAAGGISFGSVPGGTDFVAPPGSTSERRTLGTQPGDLGEVIASLHRSARSKAARKTGHGCLHVFSLDDTCKMCGISKGEADRRAGEVGTKDARKAGRTLGLRP